MERLSLWDRRSLAWEGLCSLTPLREALGTQSAEALGWEEGEYEAYEAF